MKLVAVVVTYERHDTVTRCLQHLAAQTRVPDLVVVANNGSPLPERVLPDDLEVIVLDTGSNLGPGGGFKRGMELGLAQGADFLWLMDDDIEAASECAETLLAAAPAGHVMLWPEVLTPFEETTSARVVPGWWGVMVRSATVREFGYPREDYGWWSEDTEYLQWRLQWFGHVPHIRVAGARVFHNHRDRRGPTPGWKLYYQVRNGTHMRLHLRTAGEPPLRPTVRRLARLWGSQLKRAMFATPEGESRRLRLRIVCLGVFDGVRGRLGLPIPLGDREVCRRGGPAGR